MPTRSFGESAWGGSGGTGLVPACPCCCCAEHVGSEAPHTRCGARSEDGTLSAVVGHRLDCHDPTVAVRRRGRSADAVRGSDQSGGAAEVGHR
jgi:hypothetical protein